MTKQHTLTAARDFDGMLQEAQRLLGAAEKAAKLMDSQSKAIADKDLETLEAILRQKQTYIDQLLEFRDLKATYEFSLLSLSIPRPLEAVYAELENAIKSLAIADQNSIHHLKEHHAKLAKDLELLMRGREAASCYSQPLQNQPKSKIDISG